MKPPDLITIAETDVFQRRALERLTEARLDELKAFVAEHPAAGAVIPGGGGVRKLRWSAPGRGKRGGVRVIYYYYNDTVPLYLLDIFAKNERDDIDKKALPDLARLAKAIAAYGRRQD